MKNADLFSAEPARGWMPWGALAPVLAVITLWVRFDEKRPLASIGFTGDRKLRTFCRGYLVGLESLLGIVLIIWLAGGFTVGELAGAWKSGPALLSIALLVPYFLAAMALIVWLTMREEKPAT